MDLLLSPFMFMGLIFISMPFVALFPALIFAWYYKKTGQKSILSVSLLWLCYLFYEYAMKLRVLCSGECNIRIDLLLLYPVLIIATIMAILKIRKFYL